MAQPPSPLSIAIQSAEQPLTWWQRSLIVLLVLAIVIFGLSLALETTPSQVLQSSLQAGWNVRHHKGIYDEQHRVYRGPPLMAIAAAPFGNPSDGKSTGDSVPYPLTRAFWFFVNVLCFWLATHWMVSLLEVTAKPVSPLRWWLLRLLPLLLLIVPLTESLQAGFADGMLLLLIAAVIVSLARQHFFATGLALAGAICLQFNLLVLLFVPIWRRDRLMPIGILLGLLITLVLLPGLMFGLQHTSQLNEQYFSIIRQFEQNALSEEQTYSLIRLVKQVLPATNFVKDEWAATIAFSFLGFLTLISCGLMGFKEQLDPLRLFHFIGSLLAITLLLHPLPALHSCVLLVPSIIGMLAVAWNPVTRKGAKTELTLSLAAMIALISLPMHQPVMPLSGVIVCWFVNAVLLYRSGSARKTIIIVPRARHSLPKAA